MSPWLFNLLLDLGVREVQERTVEREAQLYNDGEEKSVVSWLLFADHTVLVANSNKKLTWLMDEFGKVCRRRKLKVNAAKSKVM